MEYFLHSTMARYADALKQLEHDYGLAAVGFFWKAVELIFACNGEANYASVLALRGRPLRYVQVIQIVKHSALFIFDEQESVVRVNPEIRNGLYRMPRKSSRKSTSSRGRTDACTDGSTSASGADAGTDAGTGAPRYASVPAVPSEIERKEEECENNIRATHTREESEELQMEQALQTFMASRCPSLLEMEEPLTVDEYLELRRHYDRHDIEQVLLDMHNDVRTVHTRSCFATAEKWLRVRSTRRG